MNNGFLSQEEINSLLNGNNDVDTSSKNESSDTEILSDIEKDILGEVGNISMGSASTALSTIISQPVNITTPNVAITTLRELKSGFEIPNIALDVKYTSGIIGANLLVMKVTDAAVIASLMMGGDGHVENTLDLSEIEISAVSEAMNQMIGSAATSMATMFTREVNISPPTSKLWRDIGDKLSESIDDDETIVRVAFRLTIGELVDSKIMQILPVSTAKTIVNIMTNSDEYIEENSSLNNNQIDKGSYVEDFTYHNSENLEYENHSNLSNAYKSMDEKPIESGAPANIKQATFETLNDENSNHTPRNIDLILDVPLNISVVLGRTKKSIKEVLELGVGSLIELDKLAEEPVEVLVNGKKVAYGEVVVVDENFGVRITSIISGEDRVKSLRNN